MHGWCARETLELNADGETALQLCQHVAGLALVKSARADEKDIVCADIAVLCADLAALYDWQQVPLHTLTACIGTCHKKNSGFLR